MFLSLNFPPNQGAPGARLLWHEQMSMARVFWNRSNASQQDLTYWLYYTQGGGYKGLTLAVNEEKLHGPGLRGLPG